MSDQQDVTIGEVYRLCQRIELAVKEQNGRVSKLEKDATRIKTAWTLGAVIFGFFADFLRRKLGL